MRVIDTHRHYWGKGWDPPIRLKGRAERQRAATLQWSAKGRSGSTDVEARYTKDPDGSKMIEEMDWLGTDVAVLHTVDAGLLFHEDLPTPIEEINRFHCELAKKYPGRIYALFGIDPRRRGGVKMFERAVKEWGAIGLSFWPISGFYANHRICYPYYQKCIDLGVPVTIHTGFQHDHTAVSKYGDPIHLDDVGAELPDLTVIMCHTGMDKYPSTHWWETAVCIAATKLNFYVDVADWQRDYTMPAQDDMPELMRKLKVMRDSLGAHRILFGTDQPSYDPDSRRSDELSRQWVQLFKNLPEVAKQYGVDFKQEEAELILHGNAERILKI